MLFPDCFPDELLVRAVKDEVPTICRILYELDYLYHAKLPPTPPTQLGQRLLEWLLSSPILTSVSYT